MGHAMQTWSLNKTLLGCKLKLKWQTETVLSGKKKKAYEINNENIEIEMEYIFWP